jgi:hypothetical protein
MLMLQDQNERMRTTDHHQRLHQTHSNSRVDPRLNTLFQLRLKAKEEKNEAQSQGIKMMMNSCRTRKTGTKN